MGKMSEIELKRLIQGGETNTIELKVAAPRATEMAERLCGMANAQGGLVIIGVRDSTHEIVGVPDRRIGETLDVISRAVRQMIKPELVLDPAEPEMYTISGRNVVVATVRPSAGPVYQAHGIYWIRRGTHTVSLSLTELLEVANDRGLLDWEHQPTRNAMMEDIDLEKVRAYLALRSANTRQASRFEHIERVLTGMGCVVTTSNGIVPTNAGLLFFGHHPQEHIVQGDVACVLFRETVGASRYADRRIVTGTVQELIDGAELFLSRYIAVGARVEGFKRIDIPEYSLEVLREAVINAVVHRDYSKRGESIRVFCYPDRVEIHNPGVLLPGITVEQMERGEVQSKLRNPTLANLLKDVPGYMERLGSGIRFMLDETARMGLPAPQFQEMGEFIVTFRKAPALLPLQPPTPQYAGTLWEDGQHTQPEILSQSQTDQRERRLTEALDYVHQHGFITNSIYRQLTGVSDRTAHRDLETLIERGRLKGTGQRSARRYVLG